MLASGATRSHRLNHGAATYGILLALVVGACGGDLGDADAGVDDPIDAGQEEPDSGTPDVTAPAFAGLAAAVANGTSTINLSWTAASDDVSPAGEIVYRIFRAEASGAQELAAVPQAISQPGATSATITGLAPDTAYFFVVRATDKAGNTDANTVEKTATTASDADVTAPTFAGVTAAVANGTSTINLAWTAASDDVTAAGNIVYRIFQAESSGAQTFTTAQATSAPGATSAAITGLAPNTAYFFVVRASDEAGNSDSNIVERTATTAGAGDVTAPAFAGVASAVASSTTKLTVSWSAASDVGTPASSLTYQVFLATTSAGQTFAGPSATTLPGATSHVFFGLVPDRYFVVVRARDLASNQDSNAVEVSVDMTTAPAPAVLTWGTNFEGQVNGDKNNPSEVLSPQEFFPALAGQVVDSAAGVRFSVAVLDDGTVRTWGRNDNGELGTGNASAQGGLVQVRGIGGTGFLEDVIHVVAQGQASAALLSDGRVVQWGTTPELVLDVNGIDPLTDIMELAAGQNHFLALRPDGTVVGWGDNSRGTLGDDTVNFATTPVQTHGEDDVGFFSEVVDIEAGQHTSYAIRADSSLWAWGSDDGGVLGNGEEVSEDKLTPVQVLGVNGVGFLVGVTAVEGGTGHTLALLEDGTVVAWGRNFAGNPGNGPGISTFPVPVVGIDDAIAVAAGESASFAILADGTLVTWGGAEANPTAVSGIERAASIHSGISSNHHVVRAGLGEVQDLTPPAFAGVAAATTISDVAVKLSWAAATDAITLSGALRYLVFQATTSGGQDFNTPTAISPAGATSLLITGLTPGTTTHYVVRARDEVGNVEQNTVERSATTLLVPDVTAPVFAGATSAVANLTTRMTVSWNAATDNVTAADAMTYEIYLATASGGHDFSSPTELSALGATTHVLSDLVPARYFVVVRARDTAGNPDINQVEFIVDMPSVPSPLLFTWGSNFEGQVNGNKNDETGIETPNAHFAALANNVVDIAAGTKFSVVALADGTVRAWGRNDNSELGIGTDAATPGLQQVLGLGGDGFLSGVAQVVAQGGTTLARLANTKVAAWGQGAGFVPALVVGVGGTGELNNIIDVATSEASFAALRDDGTVVAWGDNFAGALGDNQDSGTFSSEPVAVHGENNAGLLSLVAAIEAGGHCIYAVLQDGSLLAWGDGGFGVLGNNDNTTSPRLFPVRVRSVNNLTDLANVKSVEGGHFHALALLNSGQVVAWGSNGNGQLGNNSSASSLIPVEVFEMNDAVAIAAGESESFAIRADGTVWQWGGGFLTPIQVAGIARATSIHSGINSQHHIAR